MGFIGKISRFSSTILVKFLGCDHFMCIMVPLGHPYAQKSHTYSEFKNFTLEQKLAELEETLAEWEPILKEKDVSGFYASVSSALSFQYSKSSGDAETFAFSCYPLICAHIFAPAHRLSEQEAYSPFHGPGKLNFVSTLTQIEYNIEAGRLYGSARHLGRKKYLSHYFTPVLTEVFKGIEYLARLYFIDLDEHRAKKRFSKFLASFSDIPEERIEALWELRCGLIHANTLYNEHGGNVWRFGINTRGGSGSVIVQDRLESLLRGKHFTLNSTAFINVFYEAKSFVENDMLSNPHKYLSKTEFFTWIREYFSIQYLPTREEMKKLVGLADMPDLFFDKLIDRMPYYGVVKVRAHKLYVFRLALPRIRADLVSRIRDFKTRL